MKFSLFLLVILTINLASCLNKPDHLPLHEYELVIDSIIEGYDSKDIEVYKNAQYRIAESFILIFALIGGRSFFTHHYGHNIPTIYYILFILPFTYIIPPLFYQLYKWKWLNVGFLLLVWLSPLV